MFWNLTMEQLLNLLKSFAPALCIKFVKVE